MKLESYNPAWSELYKSESWQIKSLLGNELLGIEHIGSTAIKGIASKPIIDIAVLFSKIEDKELLATRLSSVGYAFHPERSSVERIFFSKGDPVKFHLSVTEKDITPFWDRQIVFRDYLNSHAEKIKEYEQIKINLLEANPSAGPEYSAGKNRFVQDVLRLASQDKISSNFVT